VSGSTRRATARAGLVLVAFVVLGFALNAAVRMPCRTVCGSDLGRLYQDHSIDRAHAPFFQRDLEYPPLIGIEMYAATVPFDEGFRGKFLVNALLMTGLAAATTWCLWRRYGAATWRWALSPVVLVQGLQNWDLLAVAPATIGLLQWEAGQALVAGVLIGLGAAAKLYPALFLPILVAACRPDRAWRQARDVVLGFVVGAGAITVPVYVAAPKALRFFIDFHRLRPPSRDAIWFYVFRNTDMKLWLASADVARLLNVVTAALVAAALIALVFHAARGRLAPNAACALVTIAFLVSNKIYSPQYDLWLVPFFVMVPVRIKLVVHFYVSSFCVFVLTAGAASVVSSPASLYLVGAAVGYRLVVLALLARDFARPEVVRPAAVDHALM
jgi:uncharacterized membrane protein